MTRSRMLRFTPILLTMPVLVSCQALRRRRKGGEKISGENQAIPGPAGDEIAAWARSVHGSRIDRGECWDLARVALDRHGCQHPALYEFGRKLSPREIVLPGDIIQFHKTRFEWTEPDRSRHWLQLGQPDHTAIVLNANGSHLQIAHQNFKHVREVTFLDLNLAHHKSGRYHIYRPFRAETGT